MGAYQYLQDRLENLVSRMGGPRDKASHTRYVAPVLTDQEALDAYRGGWLPRKIVDIPALDSCRKWRNWQAEEEQITRIEAEERRLDVKAKVLEARIKARLFGGAAILIGTDGQLLDQPLAHERVGQGGLRHLTVLPRSKLGAGETETDPASEFYRLPRYYTLSGVEGGEVRVHPSRLVIFRGNHIPDDIGMAVSNGWGDSALMAVMQAIKHMDGTAANVASLVFEAKINVIRIPDFMANLATGGAEYENRLLQRFALAATSKGLNGDLILDKEEEFDQKSAHFSTLPEILDRFMQIVSGAADIPATRLLGQAPAGMNSTGEADLRNYYDRIQAGQELEMTPAMWRMDECLIRSALGARPEGVFYNWAPLWGITEKERAEILKIKAEAARAIAGNGQSEPMIPLEALSDALVNALIEDGSLPGLGPAIKEYGTLAQNRDDEADMRAAATPRMPVVAEE